MAEKRAGKRSRKRLLVDFETDSGHTTGFTHDVSSEGMFVRTIRIAQIGKALRAIVHLPDGRQVPIDGTVVRSYRAPVSLRSLVPTGFGIRLSPQRPAEFVEFASRL